jgi:hypothetical protein
MIYGRRATDVRGAAHAAVPCDALPGFPFNQTINSFKFFAGVAFFATSVRESSDLLFAARIIFRLDRVIDHNPCLLHLWSKCGTKLLLQAPYQCLTERSEMRCLYSEVRVLPSCMTDDGLE